MKDDPSTWALRAFSAHKILLAVAERVAGDLPDLPHDAIRYKTALKLNDVLPRLG